MVETAGGLGTGRLTGSTVADVETLGTVDPDAPTDAGVQPSERATVDNGRDDSRSRLARHGTLWLVLGVMALAAVPRLLTASDDFVTADEPLWMPRSDGFYEALVSGHPGDASAYQGDRHTVTMPGVTTMWTGVAARGIWAAGQGVGLWSDAETKFATSALGLDVAQGLMAIVGATFLGLLVFLVAEWAGKVAAAVTGVLLATEPFLVALGAVLHTDQLLTFCGVGSLVATALALGLPHRTRWADQRWAGAVGGMLFATAWLTKVSAVMFLPGVSLLGCWAILRLRTHTADESLVRRAWSSLRPVTTWWVLGAVGLVLLTYPAVWADPGDEAYWLVRSASQGAREHTQIFLGEPTSTPGPAFYFVALPLRVTPWFLVTGMAAGFAVWRRATRGFGVAAILMAAPPFVILSLASKEFDRYGLPVLAVGATVVGIVASSAVEALRRSSPATQRMALLACSVVAVVAVANSFLVVPWGMAYFNPALGGASAAEEAVTVGWGEGLERAVAIVEDQEGEDCGEVTVAAPQWTRRLVGWLGCETTANTDTARYVVLYIYDRQRMSDTEINELSEGREVVGTVDAQGFTLAEVFGPKAVT